MAAADVAAPLDLVTGLPWPCQARILQSLPLRSCLVLSTVSKPLNELVRKDVLRGVDSLDLNNLSGLQVSEALAWAFRSDLKGLRSIAASGHACLDAMLAACQIPAGRVRLHQLTSLQLDSLKQLQDHDLALLLQKCPNLEVLSLPRSSKLTDASAAAIASTVPKLRVAGCQDWTLLTDAGVSVMAMGCPLLEDVTLDGCLRVGSESLAVLARWCPRLRRLSIAKSYGVTDAALEALAEHSNALEELTLRQCPRVSAVWLLARCPNLTSLDVSGCSKIFAPSLHTMLAGCGKTLTTLQLIGCVGISGKVLGAVGRMCPSLRSLNLRGLPLQDCHLKELAAGCTTLRSLGLAWCTKITDGGLEALVQRNPELRELDLEALYLLSDALLVSLAEHTPRLTRLGIRMCHGLTPAGITAAVAATDVRSLQLSGILDDAGTSDLAARVRRVRPDCSLHW